MSRVFISPDERELIETGALHGAEAELESAGPILNEEVGAAEAGGELPAEDFKALWQALQERSTQDVLSQIAEQFADAPGARREVLATWMAQELGYSRVWRRRSTLTREPLWDVLSAKGYQEISGVGEEALAMISRSLSPARASLHPTAALATVALWRHTEDEALYKEVRERLRERALPADPEWLFEVVGAFFEDKEQGERGLQELVEQTLEGSNWQVAALLSGLVLVHKYGRWYHSAVDSNLLRATDIASLEYPQEAQVWLDFMVDAAVEGRLQFSWLERPLQAAIRLSVGDPARQERLRLFSEEHRFDADYGRLEALYHSQLEALRGAKEGDEAPLAWLLSEVQRTVAVHPIRGQKLLELGLIYREKRRVGTRLQKLRRLLREMSDAEAFDELQCSLIGLYIRNMALEGSAVELVRQVGERVDWEENPFADAQDFELYLVVSDYEGAFEKLTCKFEGVTMEHADKFAAARVKYFVQKRLDPSRLHRLVELVFEPLELASAGLVELGFVSQAIERGVERFENRIASQDLEAEILEEYEAAGVELDSFAEIQSLPVEWVERVLKSRRQRRLLFGAVAGGLSGGLAPFSWGVLSLADLPVLLSMTAEISSRFCWYFGFDPREHQELPLEILAVALGGTRPSAIEPMLVRQNLNEYILRKSLVVGAVAHGGVRHLTGKGLVRNLQRQASARTVSRVGDMSRRLVSRNLQRRAVKSASSSVLPAVGALLGAALNVALLYDITEAAQAVLTDRFLERKYPEWARHIAAQEPLFVEEAEN